MAQEGQRRNIFLRYLGEVAGAVSQINGSDRAQLYEQLLAVAKRKTAEADVKLDDRGRPVEAEEDDLDLGENCIIVPQAMPGMDEAVVDGAIPKGTRGKRSRIATVEGDEEEPAAPPKATKGRRQAAKGRKPRKA